MKWFCCVSNFSPISRILRPLFWSLADLKGRISALVFQCGWVVWLRDSDWRTTHTTAFRKGTADGNLLIQTPETLMQNYSFDKFGVLVLHVIKKSFQVQIRSRHVLTSNPSELMLYLPLQRQARLLYLMLWVWERCLSYWTSKPQPTVQSHRAQTLAFKYKNEPSVKSFIWAGTHVFSRTSISVCRYKPRKKTVGTRQRFRHRSSPIKSGIKRKWSLIQVSQWNEWMKEDIAIKRLSKLRTRFTWQMSAGWFSSCYTMFSLMLVRWIPMLPFK